MNAKSAFEGHSSDDKYAEHVRSINQLLRLTTECPIRKWPICPLTSPMQSQRLHGYGRESASGAGSMNVRRIGIFVPACAT